jgi:hypothetical protein
MAATADRHSYRVRVALFACILPVLVGACSGVAPDVVRNTTASVREQVALAKASLVSCRGGDQAQCDSTEKNLQSIASSNTELGKLAEP